MSKVLKSIYGAPDKPLTIAGIQIDCFVLEDKTRVISQRGLLKAIGLAASGGSIKGEHRIVQFLSSKALNSLFSSELVMRTKNPIKFKGHSGIETFGYEATILQEIIRSISKAYLKGTLPKRYEEIGRKAETLDDGFSKTGIIALIDEATGYEKVRDKDTLQEFLNKFLLQEHAKWVKTYPDEFFEMIFKMKNWTWYYAGQKKPSVMGHYINDFVYSRLAPTILTELKKLNPTTEKGNRNHKHTQFIDENYGHPKLKEHIHALIALGKAAGYNWNNFKRMVERAFPKFGDTMQLDFKDED